MYVRSADARSIQFQQLMLVMNVLLIWSHFVLIHLSLAAIDDDNELRNKISDSDELKSDLDEEMLACEAKDGCGQLPDPHVPHSPLIPCDRM